MDGAIKVWNAVVYSQVHEFVGHYNCVTGKKIGNIIGKGIFEW